MDKKQEFINTELHRLPSFILDCDNFADIYQIERNNYDRICQMYYKIGNIKIFAFCNIGILNITYEIIIQSIDKIIIINYKKCQISQNELDKNIRIYQLLEEFEIEIPSYLLLKSKLMNEIDTMMLIYERTYTSQITINQLLQNNKTKNARKIG